MNRVTIGFSSGTTVHFEMDDAQLKSFKTKRSYLSTTGYTLVPGTPVVFVASTGKWSHLKMKSAYQFYMNPALTCSLTIQEDIADAAA